MECRADYVLVTAGASAGLYTWSKLRGNGLTFLQRLSLFGLGAYGIYKTWQRIKVQIYKMCARSGEPINVGFRQKFKEHFVFLKERDTSETRNIDTNKNVHMTRILAEKSIRMFITESGYTPYMFSSSTTQSTDAVDCHLIYSYRDFDLPFTFKKITDEHVLCMMDVKSGYDLREWLWMGRPIILYSFFPTKVGGECMDGVFSINRNIITIENKAGRRYQHQALNIDEDFFVIRGLFNSLVVTVDQYVDPCDPDRRVVCLTPASWYKSLANWFTPNECIFELERMTYQFGSGNMLLTLVKKANGIVQPSISIGKVDEPEDLLIDYENFMKHLQYTYLNHTLLARYSSERDLIVDFAKRKGWFNPRNVMAIRLKYPTVGRIKVVEE